MAKSDLKAIAKRLGVAAAGYPGATLDSPWGETVYKVQKKVFIFLGRPSDGLSMSLKLPQSSDAALMLPFTEPTGYGLGKAGWVTVTFAAGDAVPEGLLIEWLDESYRAVAPKKLVKLLDSPMALPESKKTPAKVKPKKRPARA